MAAVGEAGVIGIVELVWRSQLDRTAELGFVFNPDHGGRGLATEAATALLDWGFTEFGLHRVYGRCHGRNAASARLMARLGMRREAHHVAELPVRGGVGRPARLRDPGPRVAGRTRTPPSMIDCHGDVRVGSTPQPWRPSHSR